MEEIKTRTPTRIGWNTYLVFINYHSTHSLPRRYPFLMLFKPQFITLGHDVKNDNANAPSTRKAGRSDRSRSTDSFVLKSILCDDIREVDDLDRVERKHGSLSRHGPCDLGSNPTSSSEKGGRSLCDRGSDIRSWVQEASMREILRFLERKVGEVLRVVVML